MHCIFKSDIMGSQWVIIDATLCIDSGSYPDVIVGGQVAIDVSGVHDATRLDDHDLAFVFCDRPVLDTLGYDTHLAGVQFDGAVLEFDLHAALDDDECLVGVGMMVPDELALDFDQFELVVVHLGDDLG